MNTNYKKIGVESFVLALICVGMFGMSSMAFAAAPVCTFTRDLQMGVTGDDVKCLQTYLNDAGYVIATTGAGSPGKETGEFKTLTEAALIKWQQGQ